MLTFFSFSPFLPSIPCTFFSLPCSILNKLTPEKFDKLCLELLNVGVDSKLVLKGIILLVSLLSSVVVLRPTGLCLSILAGRSTMTQSTPPPPFLPPAQIVDKALEEPKYSSLYAQLCLRLAEDAPNFDGSSSEIQSSQKQSTVSVAPTRLCAAHLKAQESSKALCLPCQHSCNPPSSSSLFLMLLSLFSRPSEDC